MRFLVLGGAGYVGSHFVYHASDCGHEVAVYDSCERGHPEFLPMPVTKGSICDVSVLSDCISAFKPDVILNYAAYALVAESVAKPLSYFRNNAYGVMCVFEAMRAAKSKASFIFSSTCAVYGSPESLPINESSPKNPDSPYGLSKRQAEEIIETCAQEFGIAAAALRYFNACGADLKARTGELHNPETHLIPNAIAAAHRGETLKIFGNDYPTKDGTCVRDYIHVLDLAESHLQAVKFLQQQEAPKFFAINIGTGKGYSNKEVCAAVERAVGKTLRIEFSDRRPGDSTALYADPRQSRELLNFIPKHSDIDTICATANAWYCRVNKIGL